MRGFGDLTRLDLLEGVYSFALRVESVHEMHAGIESQYGVSNTDTKTAYAID